MFVYDSPFGGIPDDRRSITERVFAGLDLTPDAVVLIDGVTGETVTAGALKAQIQRLAGGLGARGIGPGRTVALMAPNCPAFCAVFHAVAWAGATVTTINPAYTAAEVRQQLTDARAVLLVVVEAMLDTARVAVAGTGVTEIIVIGAAEGATTLSALEGPSLTAQVPVDAALHVVALPYSSGTTGLPKGVMLSHRNLVANLAQIRAVTPIAPGETTIAILPFFHIYGMEVLVNLYLGSGACLVTLPRFDLEAFLRLAQDHRAERLWIVPPVMVALAKHPLVDRFDLSSVIEVLSGAAPLGGDITRTVAQRLACVACQGYGMTEMSPVSHFNGIDSARPGSVGRTAAGTECRIVDVATGTDLPPGGEGELWVRGPQVMLGYLNNEAATAMTLTGDGWLKTGDIGVYDDDGYLYIRDRLKELIKVKGFQVAPAELEAILLTHPGIADAAVIGVADDEAGEVPMAFVVAASGVTLGEDEVMAHVAGQVASYKQLRRVAFIDVVPKSASGKILRRVLRERV